MSSVKYTHSTPKHAVALLLLYVVHRIRDQPAPPAFQKSILLFQDETHWTNNECFENFTQWKEVPAQSNSRCTLQMSKSCVNVVYCPVSRRRINFKCERFMSENYRPKSQPNVQRCPPHTRIRLRCQLHFRWRRCVKCNQSIKSTFLGSHRGLSCPASFRFSNSDRQKLYSKTMFLCQQNENFYFVLR